MITVRAPQRIDRSTEAEERTRPNLRVVDTEGADPKPDGERRRSAGGVVGTLLVALLFVCIFGVVVFQVFLVQTQSHLDSLDNQLTTQDQRAKQLRLDTADLESPDRILQDGQSLGMIPPPAIAFLKPKPDDDTRDQFDPTKEKAPVAPPTTQAAAQAPTYTWTPPSTAWKPPSSSGTTGTGTTKSTTPTTTRSTATTTPTTSSTPSTSSKSSTSATPTTTKSNGSTTPTTAQRSSTTPTTAATKTR